jgi:hypothetical protein
VLLAKSGLLEVIAESSAVSDPDGQSSEGLNRGLETTPPEERTVAPSMACPAAGSAGVDDIWKSDLIGTCARPASLSRVTSSE